MGEEIRSDGYIDFHCHLLPSIDDGPSRIDESVEMARTLNKLGFTTIFCTPHLVKGVYDTSPDHVKSTVKNLQENLISEGINITLKEGIEYRLDEHIPELLSAPITLPNNMILCEPPPQIDPNFLLECIYQINRKGFRPLIAHPERNAMISGSKRLLTRLIEMDCLFQANIQSFAGSYGRSVKDRALDLLRNDFYCCVGSDSHNSFDLEERLKKGMIKIKIARPHSYYKLLHYCPIESSNL